MILDKQGTLDALKRKRAELVSDLAVCEQKMIQLGIREAKEAVTRNRKYFADALKHAQSRKPATTSNQIQEVERMIKLLTLDRSQTIAIDGAYKGLTYLL